MTGPLPDGQAPPAKMPPCPAVEAIPALSPAFSNDWPVRETFSSSPLSQLTRMGPYGLPFVDAVTGTEFAHTLACTGAAARREHDMGLERRIQRRGRAASRWTSASSKCNACRVLLMTRR